MPWALGRTQSARLLQKGLVITMVIEYKKQEMPVILPVPDSVNGVSQPMVCLSGVWKFKSIPVEEVDTTSADFADWLDFTVPDDMGCHKDLVGERISKYVYVGKYTYKRMVEIPKEYEGKRIFLRFEGTNGFAEVWVNGKLAGRHYNAFLTWNCEITDFVTPGEPAVLAVGIDERSDRVSTFNHGGIIHDVYLMAAPKAYVSRLHVDTFFDGAYRDATMKIRLALGGVEQSGAQVALRLYDPNGAQVALEGAEVAFAAGEPQKIVEIPVKAPKKWDSEHPYRYRLEAALSVDGQEVEKTSRMFGFRQIDLRENQMFVNGQEVKLRGACRHETTPHTGRYVPKETIELDVQLFKEANCNYIRTSHYPPNEYFLDMCDKYGIYVEDEMALAFIARTLDYTQQDPSQAQRYVSHFAELCERDRSHPCVVIWSLCNESFGGYNFNLLNQYAHREDPTRPTKFSYPMTMQEEHEPIDVWSIHYSNWDVNLAQKRDNVSVGGAPGYDKPVINDEYAHVPCYNRNEHKRDPNVRQFWGEGLRIFWDNIWNTKGSLGGAIWAGIDETDVYTGGNTCLEWGIIDTWRRKKPEFFGTRKAYSPIRLESEQVTCLKGAYPTFTVENRFCHTNFYEIRVEWESCGESGVLAPIDLEPRQKGVMTIPVSNVWEGRVFRLKFFDAFGYSVDEIDLTVNPRKESLPAPCGFAPAIREDEKSIEVAGERFRLVFCKKDCQLVSGSWKGNELLKGGPCLNAPYMPLPAWEGKQASCSIEGNQAKVVLKGSYGDAMDVTFTLFIDAEGLMTTRYTLDKISMRMPRAQKLRVGVDCGGVDEIGVYYVAPGKMDHLSWRRKGVFTAYPEDQIGRTEGECSRYNGGADPVFGEPPRIPWSQDSKSYVLYGKYALDTLGTNDFRSTKENIYCAAVSQEGETGSIVALSDGGDSIRLETIPDPACFVDDRDASIRYVGNWFAVDDPSGSWEGTETWSQEKGDYAEFTFEGTGAAWIGSADVIYGNANIYLDGQKVDTVSQRVCGVEFAGSAPGYDKRYGIPMYSVTGLPYGKHTLRIEVDGTKARDSGGYYVVIDAFRILGKKPDDVKVIINNDFNYPHIAWGNYTKPAIMLQDGYTNSVTMRLAD